MARDVIAKVSEETLKIERYIEPLPPGEVVAYETVAEETGVLMDLSGKAKLRSALRRLKREYSQIKGYGVRLADPEMVMPLISHRVVKIDSAVRRADKTHKNLQRQFFASLTPDEQRQVLFAGAVFGAIRVAAENGRQLYGGNAKQKLGVAVIPLPDFG